MYTSNKRRRARDKIDAPLTLDELTWDKDLRRVFDYLGSRRANNLEDAIGIGTASEELKMSLSKIRYAMRRLQVSGFGVDDSDLLYLTPDRGMRVYMELDEAKRRIKAATL